MRQFPDLCGDIERFDEFRKLDHHNYDISTEELTVNLVNNLANTEAAVVLETPNHLFIGEANHEMTFGGNGDLVLVHQLIRQYVMANIQIEFSQTRDRKEVIPFVVGDSIDKMKKAAQVRFMID